MADVGSLLGFGGCLIYGICGIIWLGISIGVAMFIYNDAKKHNYNPVLWGILTFFGFLMGLLLGIIVIVIYFVTRPSTPVMQYAPPPGQPYQPQQPGYQVNYNRPPPPPGY